MSDFYRPEDQDLNNENDAVDTSEFEGPEEDLEQAESSDREDGQYLKRQAKRKRKRTLWKAVRLSIAAVICIPLIFFCFWTAVKLFFPVDSNVTGLKEKIAKNADKTLKVSFVVTNPEARELELQRLDEEKGAWVTERTYETGTDDSEEMKITFPGSWTEYTYSKWRLHMDRAFGVQGVTSDPFDVTCRNRGNIKFKCTAACIYCKDNGEVLYNVNMNKEIPNASTTKMITAILALENSSMDEVVKISHRAMITPYAYFGIHSGYRFYMKDLMRGMLIMSGNECATAIGEHVGGTYEHFRDMMNKRAKELGCKHSHFMTPSGLDVYGHYSTAYDIALINAKAIEFDEYNKIMLMKKYKLKSLDKDDEYEYELETTNELLDEKIKGYMGGKTGTTAQAGHCLSSAYKWKGKTYILTVFNAGNRFDATKKLIKYVKKYAE